MNYGKSPWTAAFLNFLLWGAGYIYIRHRMVLGVGLTLVNVINLSFMLSLPRAVFTMSLDIFFTWLSVFWVIMSSLLALDVYRETKEINSI